ncbi:kinase-like protein [Marasmius fiardii PR-910]|nr:kinase-like protein [Marasmius fiardii PR-910]
MVSPWMVNGSIIQFLKKNPKHDKLAVIREIASGIAYLHSRRVTHGDIKPMNILVDESGHCHLADFGLAAIVSERASLNASITNRHTGTLRYMAPETILPLELSEHTSKVDKFAADIYAYACTVLEIITGQPPFPKFHNASVINLFMNQNSRPGERPTEAGTWCPDNIWTLIEKCWHGQPQLRPKANEVHAFLEYIEELRRLGEAWEQTHIRSNSGYLLWYTGMYGQSSQKI